MMRMSLHNVCIVIPTKRSPPLDTLMSFRKQFPLAVPVFVIADPSLYLEHKRWLKKNVHRFGDTAIHIVKGKSGLVHQVRFCYDYARKQGFKYAFRLDDDCRPDFFVSRAGKPSLEKVMEMARACMHQQKVSLVGFSNTSRLDWLRGGGYSRSYGLIHGAAQMFRTLKSGLVLPKQIVCYEDIYRSCAHRRLDGAVGRVNAIGMNKIDGMKNTVNREGKKRWKLGMQQLLAEFPGYGTFHGEANEKGIPRFRHRRHDGYQSHPST